MNDRALYPYQRHAARWLYQRKAAALFAGVGSGKTAIIAHVLKRHLDECSIRKVLLVAPIAVCKAVWRQECDEWDSLRGQLSFSLAVGTPAQRLKAVHADVDVCLINYDSLVWYLNLPDRPKFDALVLDESTNVQSASSVRFKGKGACKKKVKDEVVKIPKVFGLKDRLDFDYVYLMTATPKSNKYMGLWSQSYCMDKGERLGKNITAFRKKYYYRYGPEHYHIKLRDDEAKEEIKDKLRDICYHIPRSVIAATLPRVMVRNYFVDLPPKAWKVYKQLEDDFIAEVNQNVITVEHIAIRSGKLHQVCQGTVYDDDRNPVRIHTEKMDMFSSIVEGLGDRNAVVIYNYKPTLAELRAKYPAPVISSALSDKKYNALIDGWSGGKYPIVYGHAKAMGHGLNLQHGGHDVILFGLMWSLDLYQQVIGRLRRNGQKNDTVFVHRIIARGTIEELLMAPRLKKRSESQKDFIEHFIKWRRAA